MSYEIYVKIIEEAGYKSAMLGLSLNKNQNDVKLLRDLMLKLSPKDYGHNKFLESIDMWILVIAPRDWWQEMDTYRMTTKQSDSTMHTLRKELINGNISPTCFECGDVSIDTIKELEKRAREKQPVENIKRRLPEGFLQTRVIKLNYKNLFNIITQRQNHEMPHWKYFCRFIRSRAKHYSLLPKMEGLWYTNENIAHNNPEYEKKVKEKITGKILDYD